MSPDSSFNLRRRSALDLFHVSDRGDIEVFEPRQIANTDSRKLVWAVDDEHLVNYLLPRECPRVCFRQGADTSAADHQRFFQAGAGPVVAIEAAWLARVVGESLWLYAMPAAGFIVDDVNAGYFVSARPVVPASCRLLERPVEELLARGVELRVLPRLHELAAAVARSTLSFSLIRMRNALT